MWTNQSVFNADNLIIPVQKKQSKGKTEPDANKTQFFGRWIKQTVEDIQAKYHSKKGTKTAKSYRMPFKFDLHPKYCESSCCHTCKTNGLHIYDKYL